MFEPVIRELNQRNAYTVVIKSAKPDEVIRVENIPGVWANDETKIAEELSDCDIATISVRQRGLP